MFNGKQCLAEVGAFMELRPYFLFCPGCGEKLKPECTDHDPCIKQLPHTDDACCGHGIATAAYVTLKDGTVLRGKDAVEYFNQWSRLPVPYFELHKIPANQTP